MEDIVNKIIDAVLDALENFFDTLTLPTLKIMRDTFMVSLIFLGFSIITRLLNLYTFISWQEALVAVILLGAVNLVDVSTRNKVKNQLDKIRDITGMFNSSDINNIVEEVQEYVEEYEEGNDE